ncbi:hypothetical protein [Acidovorax sp. BLS4]|uniref:hypothetical protein n=1 Tax=Acidovorax sp. BLS4 TaxID=3273430 RepID=UPI0029421AEA|nr:hypothetical protein [Paracidovorax avenae]WOI43499.1 hypothetical protein R1Z03_13170 [Paracidovorax avenae]
MNNKTNTDFFLNPKQLVLYAALVASGGSCVHALLEHHEGFSGLRVNLNLDAISLLGHLASSFMKRNIGLLDAMKIIAVCPSVYCA